MADELPEYVIGGAVKVFRVLEAMDGADKTPLLMQRIAQRVKHHGITENATFRALRTLAFLGYARDTERGWMLTARALRLGERLELAATQKE